MKTSEIKTGMYLNFDYHGPLGVSYDRDFYVERIADGVMFGWERNRSYPIAFPMNGGILKGLGWLGFDEVDRINFWSSIER